MLWVLGVRNKQELNLSDRQLEDKSNLSPTLFTCPVLCHMIHLTYLRILIGSKYEDAMASSGNPDQTAPLGAVWSGSALSA